MFTEWFGAAIAQWENEHGVRLGPRGLQRMMTKAGYPVSAGYLSMLCKGHRQHPSRELIDALAGVLGASAAGLVTTDAAGSGAEPPAAQTSHRRSDPTE